MDQSLIQLLKKEVKPAMGCTEPVAVTLAVARARVAGQHKSIDKITVSVSPNIFKNGLSVGIPKSDEVGIVIASAIGAVSGNPDLCLEIYDSISEKDIVSAKKFIKDNKLSVKLSDTDEKVFIGVEIISEAGLTTLKVTGMHNHVSYLAHNGIALIEEDHMSKEDSNPIEHFTLESLLEEIECASYDDLKFLLEGLKMNGDVANAGLQEPLGLGIGYNTYKSIDKGLLGDDLANRAMYFTAAASDARMSGIALPVMSSNGSGNNGLTAILPILAYDKQFETKEADLVKALAISHLFNCYIKAEIGRLSALCSCGISAATGAGAAITWLMGGTKDQVLGTVQNMIANVSGMICDGAKDSCALKLATAASLGVKSAIWSIQGSISKAHDGIVGRTVEESVKNLGLLSKEGMQLTDNTILNIMQNMQV
jgi:L-cysteine desulfidase